jgi:hypothetical protein
MSNISVINGEYREQGHLPIKFDPTKYKTASGAAKAFHRALCELSRELGQKPEIEILLCTPERSQELGTGRCWRVIWESGPFEWGVAMSINNLFRRGYWYTEPYYSFDVCFYAD